MKNIRNAHSIGISVQYADFGARTDTTWLYNREIKPAFSAHQESLDHVIRPESESQLIARHSGLGHN